MQLSFLSLFAFGVLCFSSSVTAAIKHSLNLCIKTIFPSVFPFLVVSNMVINMKYSDFIGKRLAVFMPRVFSLGKTLFLPLILGFIGGYPIGAATISATYKAGNCSKKEAERALSFCNNCGPAFLLGTVGGVLFSSPKLGCFLLVIHIFSAIIVGVLFRTFSPFSPTKESDISDIDVSSISFFSSFTRAISSAVTSSITISAYVVFFSVVFCLLNNFGIIKIISEVFSFIFSLNQEVVAAFISGLFEMTSGIIKLSETASHKVSFVLTSFLVGWGGISVHMQTHSLLSESDLNMRQYYPGKLLHGVLSAILSLIVVNIFTLS